MDLVLTKEYEEIQVWPLGTNESSRDLRLLSWGLESPDWKVNDGLFKHSINSIIVNWSRGLWELTKSDNREASILSSGHHMPYELMNCCKISKILFVHVFPIIQGQWSINIKTFCEIDDGAWVVDLKPSSSSRAVPKHLGTLEIFESKLITTDGIHQQTT